MVVRKKSLAFLILLVFLCLLLTIALPHSKAQSSNERFISGQVLDDATNQPIANASVSVWNTLGGSPPQWMFVETQKTDGNGEFVLEVSDRTLHRVYIYYDDLSSPGFDYTPAFKDLPVLGGDVSLSVRLLPAASIIFEGNLWFVEAIKPSDSFTFIIPELDAASSSDYGYVSSYGTFPNPNFLNESSKHVIVPVDSRVQVKVNASILISRERISKSLVIDDVETFNLTKGKLVRVNVERYTCLSNYGFMERQTDSSKELLKEIDETGFYAVVEKQDLAQIVSLLELARTKIGDGQYDKAYIDIREAYLKNVVLSERLKSTYTDAVGSVFTLTFFLALTSIVLSLLLFERLSTKLATYPVFFTAFFSIFYYTYPGCALITFHIILGYIFLSLGGVLLLTLIIPTILKEKVVSTFSLSKRKLRRRRTRFALTVVTITVLVMSFVSLTSFSTGYGLTTRRNLYPFNNIPEGLLIQQPQPSDSQIVVFIPLEPSSIELLKEKPEILQVAPKAENQPLASALGYLRVPSTSQSAPLFGFLGIQPSAEAEITGIDNIVVDGRYLRDDDEGSILVSDGLAMRIGVEVGSKVSLTYGIQRQVTVVGFFDANRLRSVKDVNGEGLSPSKLMYLDPESPPIRTTCEPDEVIIMSLRDAMKYHSIPVSRIDVLIDNTQGSSSFARELALEQGLSVWYSQGNSVYEVVVGSFLEEKGSSIFVPWLIVILNVVMTMLNSIFEYRKEIATLSAVGLNPSDIIGLFIAEAAVIGVVGGGVGYLLGVSNYKLMSMLSIVVEVRPKVSAVWSFASVLVSISAVLVGAFVALHSSVVITPSMLRRWKVEKEPPMGEPWVFDLPFRLRKEELDSLFDYLTKRFRTYLLRMGIDENIGGIRYSEDENQDISTRRVHFNYRLAQKSRIGSFPFQLVAKKGRGEETFSFEVVCRGGSEETIKETVSFVRMSMIEWSANQTR